MSVSWARGAVIACLLIAIATTAACKQDLTCENVCRHVTKLAEDEPASDALREYAIQQRMMARDSGTAPVPREPAAPTEEQKAEMRATCERQCAKRELTQKQLRCMRDANEYSQLEQCLPRD